MAADWRFDGFQPGWVVVVINESAFFDGILAASSNDQLVGINELLRSTTAKQLEVILANNITARHLPRVFNAAVSHRITTIGTFYPRVIF